MPNEILLILSLIAIYGAVLLSFVLFGEKGLITWTVLATIAANIEVLILVKAFGLVQTLGNVMFASTFLVTDILSEIYGKKQAKQAVNMGIFALVCFLLISQLWLFYTPTEGDYVFPSIQGVFENTPRVMIAGLIVYAIVQRFDVWLYHRLWQLTEKTSGSRRKALWLRNNLATLTSQLLNTILFTFGAFAGTYSLDELSSIILTSYLIYFMTALADTPIVYLARRIHEKRKLRRDA
ncbi:MAG: queuosine precursor transporter [Peptococcaceae bacterium]|nr:queuosine precursor transporter [Peptococcaceae bacterium]